MPIPEWLLYRSDGEPQRLGRPSADHRSRRRSEWQRHWLAATGGAADALGFSGFHLDTYGYPRAPLDDRGRPVADARAPTRRSCARCARARPATC